MRAIKRFPMVLMISSRSRGSPPSRWLLSRCSFARRKRFRSQQDTEVRQEGPATVKRSFSMIFPRLHAHGPSELRVVVASLRDGITPGHNWIIPATPSVGVARGARKEALHGRHTITSSLFRRSAWQILPASALRSQEADSSACVPALVYWIFFVRYASRVSAARLFVLVIVLAGCPLFVTTDNAWGGLRWA